MIIVHHAAARLHTWIRSLDTREYEYLKRTPVIEEIWLDVIERLEEESRSYHYDGSKAERVLYENIVYGITSEPARLGPALRY